MGKREDGYAWFYLLLPTAYGLEPIKTKTELAEALMQTVFVAEFSWGNLADSLAAFLSKQKGGEVRHNFSEPQLFTEEYLIASLLPQESWD